MHVGCCQHGPFFLMNEEALGIPRGSRSRAERLWTPAACGRGSRKLRRIHVWLGPGERQTETEEGRERQRRGEAGRQREARPLARKHAHRRTRLSLARAGMGMHARNRTGEPLGTRTRTCASLGTLTRRLLVTPICKCVCLFIVLMYRPPLTP